MFYYSIICIVLLIIEVIPRMQNFCAVIVPCFDTFLVYIQFKM